jgi:hypothetical protein
MLLHPKRVRNESMSQGIYKNLDDWRGEEELDQSWEVDLIDILALMTHSLQKMGIFEDRSIGKS